MSDLIQRLTMLRMNDMNLSELSDEEFVAKFFEIGKQMEKAYKQWHDKQPVKVV